MSPITILDTAPLLLCMHASYRYRGYQRYRNDLPKLYYLPVKIRHFRGRTGRMPRYCGQLKLCFLFCVEVWGGGVYINETPFYIHSVPF